MKGSFKYHIIATVKTGRVAGSIMENGFLKMCTDRGIGVHLLASGARFEPFVERYQCEGVRFSYLPSHRQSADDRLLARLNLLAGRLEKWGVRRASTSIWKVFGERVAAKSAGDLGDLVEKERPDGVVSFNISAGVDLGTIARARRLGIPTLGNVFSWDHPFRVQQTRAEKVTCWSKQIKRWLVEFSGYSEKQIEIVGAPAFDSYFGRRREWSREELACRLELDPSRPILVFATLGQFRQMIDETGPFRELMTALDAGRIEGRPQVILRFHPMSRSYFFEEYRDHPDVVFSRFTRYCPGMSWWPSSEEVELAGNILRHADVCLSPGSTMAIEPSIFDTPTIVPAFNPFTTEEFENFFRTHWLNKHFRFLKERKLLPFVFSREEMVDSVNRAMKDTSWMAEGRDAIRRELLGPLDGRSTERLVDVVGRLVRGE